MTFNLSQKAEYSSQFVGAEMNIWWIISFSSPCLQMVVYSLGMTLYWCVDYHLPQNQVRSFSSASCSSALFHIRSVCTWSTLLFPVSSQPVQLSAELEGLLLSMCEDMMVRRTDLLTVLEACELHHKASMLPPAERLVRQLVEDVYRNSVSVCSAWCPLVRRGQVCF